MRLINADSIMRKMKNMLNESGNPLLAEKAIALIDHEPTAFDKEKVIEELKEIATHSASCKNQCEFGSTEYFDYMGAEVAYKTTIEIIEKGGIE